MSKKFAEQWWAFKKAKNDFEDSLEEAAGFEFAYHLRTDDYDSSIEIDGAPPNARLNEAAQRLISEAGFSTAYLNHTDGWETHYSWGAKFEKPVPGWGRRRTETGFEITYWPEGWTSPSTKDWLSSGYMKIVDRESPSLEITHERSCD